MALFLPQGETIPEWESFSLTDRQQVIGLLAQPRCSICACGAARPGLRRKAMHPKIMSDHLARQAIVYVRQSTLRQVAGKH